MKQKIFLSYAWQDRDRVDLALQRLRDAHVAGVESLLDITDPVPDAKLGQDLRTKIRNQIEKANVVVLIWTKQAEASDWVQYEVGIADALGKPVRE